MHDGIEEENKRDLHILLFSIILCVLFIVKMQVNCIVWEINQSTWKSLIFCILLYFLQGLYRASLIDGQER